MEIGKINFGPELGSKEHPMIPAKDFKWPAQDASEDASLLDTSSPSPTHGQEDFRILLGRQAKMEGMLESIMGELVSLSTQVGHLIEALAEDQDPDEMPATYLDGSRV